MCLSLPGKILSLSKVEEIKMACVDFGGITREICVEWIPEAELEQIFNEFYRAGNTSEYQGSGVGLSLVKMCIERHGGTISATNNTDGGSTFIMEFPMITPPPAT